MQYRKRIRGNPRDEWTVVAIALCVALIMLLLAGCNIARGALKAKTGVDLTPPPATDFDAIDDLVRECIDDRDNGSDIFRELGLEGVGCHCYEVLVHKEQVIFTTTVHTKFGGGNIELQVAEPPIEFGSERHTEQSPASPTSFTSREESGAAPATHTIHYELTPKLDPNARPMTQVERMREMCDIVGAHPRCSSKDDGVLRCECKASGRWLRWTEQ